ncbi:hypothetical protein CJF30_00007861 [Rutstroemia sp. NJR-2017a BBW]|nr:hypothetical protein CJF30_00007861 [Rutstroemia sp. NJR-2017a BBW]
MKKWIY